MNTLISLIKPEGVKYEGVRLMLGEREVVVPALSIGQVQQNLELIKEVREMKSADTSGFQIMLKSVPLIAAAIRRNYPQIANEEVGDNLDLNNFRHFAAAVFGATGLKAEQGEAKAATTNANASEPESAASPLSK